MKKNWTIYILILCFGIGIGVIGSNIFRNDQKNIIIESVIDTIVHSKIIEIPVEVQVEIEKKITKVDTVYVSRDSIFSMLMDSIYIDTLPSNLDTPRANKYVESIVRDTKIFTQKVIINYLTVPDFDSVKFQLLDVPSVNLIELKVEFWESPLNYKGYKLSKSTLILFGLPISDNTEIYKDKKTYYLKLDDLYYQFSETNSFEPYILINKPTFIND